MEANVNNTTEPQHDAKLPVSRSPIFGIFRYDDKGYCGYFLSEESAQKVLDEEYNSDEWYVDEMVCQDCD